MSGLCVHERVFLAGIYWPSSILCSGWNKNFVHISVPVILSPSQGFIAEEHDFLLVLSETRPACNSQLPVSKILMF